MGMSQEVFVNRYVDRWVDLEHMLDRIEQKDLAQPVDDFPERYRQVCRHLAVARSRGYSPAVRARLEAIVERGHSVLYRRSRKQPARAIWRYITGGFARDVRQNWRYLVVSTFVFVVPFLILMGWVVADPDMAVDVLGPGVVADLDTMYGTDDHDRSADDDLMMFAFYIFNNISIALRTFASGVVFGLGSLFILVFNGTFLGTASGYIVSAGHGDQFWPFVIGHGSFELTAIVLAGLAGLKIGAAPVWPGRRGRIDALRQAARDSVGIICGFVVMLVIAAFIEAFWSPRNIDPQIHYTVGAGLWALVIGYFVFAGRGRESR